MFDQFDTDKSGTINLGEFEALLAKIGVAPMKGTIHTPFALCSLLLDPHTTFPSSLLLYPHTL